MKPSLIKGIFGFRKFQREIAELLERSDKLKEIQVRNYRGLSNGYRETNERLEKENAEIKRRFALYEG